MSKRAKWYHRRDGVQTGPYRSSIIKERVLSGEILPSDLLWKKGLRRWMRAEEFPKLFSNGQPRQFSSLHAVACGSAAVLLFMALIMCPWSDLHAAMPPVAQSWLTNGSIMSALAACVAVTIVVLDLTRPIAKVPTAAITKPGQVDDTQAASTSDEYISSSKATDHRDLPSAHGESEPRLKGRLQQEIPTTEASHEPSRVRPRSLSPNATSSTTFRERITVTIAALLVAGAAAYWWWSTSGAPIAPRPNTLREQLIAIGRDKDLKSMPFVIDSLDDPAASQIAVTVAELVLGVRYNSHDKSDVPKLKMLIHDDWTRTRDQLRRRQSTNH